MAKKFEQPDGIPFHIEPDELPEPKESMGDRYGTFVPGTAAEANAVDRLPSHEDLLSRQPHVPLTEKEKELGLSEVEKAKKMLGFSK